MTSASELNELIRGRFAGVMGLDFVSVAPELVVSRLALKKELSNTRGSVHAGVLVTMADTTCGAGSIASLPEDAKGFVTLEVKANFVAAVSVGVLRCTARPRHCGRSTQLWDAVVECEESDQKLAFFSCTQLILYDNTNSE